MTKTELVAKIAEKSGLTKADSDKALKGFTDSITEALKAGEKVQLVGFGTFETGVRSARDGINPATKEKIHIPESKTPKFKAGKALKDSLNS